MKELILILTHNFVFRENIINEMRNSTALFNYPFTRAVSRE